MYLVSHNYNTHNFKVVEDIDKIPSNYKIWNIGRHNFEYKGYIPLCQMKDDIYINSETLLALKVSSEELALKLINQAHKTNMTIDKIKEIIEKEN